MLLALSLSRQSMNTTRQILRFLLSFNSIKWSLYLETSVYHLQLGRQRQSATIRDNSRQFMIYTHVAPPLKLEILLYVHYIER